MKPTITPNEHMQLIGCATAAMKYAKMVNQLRDAMCEVLGVDPTERGPADHVSDAVWGSPMDDPVAAVGEMLKRMEVVVDE